MKDAKSGQRVFIDDDARNILREVRLQYLIEEGERVSRDWIDPNREHDQPIIVLGSSS